MSQTSRPQSWLRRWPRPTGHGPPSAGTSWSKPAKSESKQRARSAESATQPSPAQISDNHTRLGAPQARKQNMTPKKMHLATILSSGFGGSTYAWLDPRVEPRDWTDIRALARYAQIAERGKFDFIFVGD